MKRLHQYHFEELDGYFDYGYFHTENYHQQKDVIALFMPFICNRNSIGPRTDPCGTPDVTST